MGDKKTKTTSTNSTNSTADVSMTGTNTSTPNAPSWVTDLSADFAGQLPGVKTQVAGLSGLQNDAMGSLSGQNFGGLFGDAASLAKSGAGALDGYNPSALGGVQSWLNPYLGEVVGATTADLDANDSRTRAQQALQLAGSKAFGGSGSALTQSLTEGELERARGTTLGNLRMGAFDSAAANSQQDANRALSAMLGKAQAGQAGASTLAGIGSAGLGLQNDLGATQRDITQQGLNIPITDLITKLGLFGQLPASLLTGQTNTSSGTTRQTGSSNGTASGTSVTHDPLGQLTDFMNAMAASSAAAAKAGA